MDSQVLTPFSSSTFHKTQFSALGQTFVKQKSGKFPWGALFKIIQMLRIKALERNIFFSKSLAKKTHWSTRFSYSLQNFWNWNYISFSIILLYLWSLFDLYTLRQCPRIQRSFSGHSLLLLQLTDDWSLQSICEMSTNWKNKIVCRAICFFLNILLLFYYLFVN